MAATLRNDSAWSCPSSAGTEEPRATPVGLFAKPTVRRALPVAGGWLAAGIADCVARSFAGGAAHAASDSSLTCFLRGMALIEAVLTLAAMRLLWRRLARPISLRFAAICLVGAWSMAAATVQIWQLWLIPLAALVFHAEGMALLRALAFDDGAWPRLGTRPRPGRHVTSAQTARAMRGDPSPECTRSRHEGPRGTVRLRCPAPVGAAC